MADMKVLVFNCRKVLEINCRKLLDFTCFLQRDAVVTELTQEMAECIPTQNGTEQEFEANYLAGLIDKFLEGFPKEQRNVFVRRYWYFDPISEICDRYGLSQSKVKSILFRMREKMKSYLEKEGFTV